MFTRYNCRLVWYECEYEYQRFWWIPLEHARSFVTAALMAFWNNNIADLMATKKSGTCFWSHRKKESVSNGNGILLLIVNWSLAKTRLYQNQSELECWHGNHFEQHTHTYMFVFVVLSVNASCFRCSLAVWTVVKFDPD